MKAYNAYRVWIKGQPWCCLVVAETAQQAKTLFWWEGPEMHENYRWIDIRVRREPEWDHLERGIYDGADQKPEGFWHNRWTDEVIVGFKTTNKRRTDEKKD